MQNRIRDLRKQRNITMKQLGNIVGLAESTISQYETGKRQPDYETLLKLGEYFEVSVGYLLGAEQNKKPTPDNEDGLNEEKRKFIEKVSQMDDDVIAALNQLADKIISQRDK